MASTTIYTCDQCGAQKSDDPDFVQSVYVQIMARLGKQQWCRECLLSLGLTLPKKNVPDPLKSDQPPTLEEAIRQIVKERESLKNETVDSQKG
jgi:hypothetical protein